MSGDALHVVRTDVLLWALEGLAAADLRDHEQIISYPRSLSPHQVRVLRAIAARPRAASGEIKRLAACWGLPCDSLKAYVSAHRRGRSPRYWRLVA